MRDNTIMNCPTLCEERSTTGFNPTQPTMAYVWVSQTINDQRSKIKDQCFLILELQTFQPGSGDGVVEDDITMTND